MLKAKQTSVRIDWETKEKLIELKNKMSLLKEYQPTFDDVINQLFEKSKGKEIKIDG